MSKQGHQHAHQPTQPSPSGKQAYQRPVLKEYGSVAHLTAGGSQGGFADAQGGMQINMP